jgi:hypothetical protein
MMALADTSRLLAMLILSNCYAQGSQSRHLFLIKEIAHGKRRID